jgi:chromosome segregation ATPase
VDPPTNSDLGDEPSVHRIVEDLLGERLEALASWIQELDAQVRTNAVAGDEKSLKELRRALEAWTKRDPKFEERLTNRVDVLADRFTTLTATVNTTAATLAGSGGEIAALRRELEDGNARIESVLADLKRAPAASTDLDELRRTVAALSSARPTGKDGRQVDGLREEVENLTARLDMLAKTVATTAAGLAGREGETASLRRSVEEGNTRIEEVLAELQRAERSDVGELEARLESLAHTIEAATTGVAGRDEVTALRARLEEGGSKLDALVTEIGQSLGALSSRVTALDAAADDSEALETLTEREATLSAQVDHVSKRIDAVAASAEGASGTQARHELELAALHRHLESLAHTIEAATTGFAQKDEVTALRARLDQGRAKLDALVTEVERSLGALSSRVVALDAAANDSEALETLAEQVARQGAHLDDLGGRIDRVAASVESTSGNHARHELDLATLHRHLEEESARVDSTLGELRQALEALPDPEAVDPQLEATLQRVASDVEALAQRLEAAERASSERWTAEATQRGEVEQLVADLSSRLTDVEHDHEARAREMSSASAEWSDERTWVREQLDALVASVSQAREAEARERVALSARLTQLEHERSGSDSELTRMTASWTAELESIEARLDEVASRRDIPPSEDEQLERLLVAFADRIEAIERDRETATSVIAGAAQDWAAGRTSLETRLDQVTGRVDALVAAERDPAAGRIAEEELGRLRLLVDGLRMRLAANESEIAAALGPRDVVLRLDELTSRLESLESSGPPDAPSTFLLELRALELRLEQTETAAREDRDALLAGLERLASSVEWRLQRLESGEVDEIEAQRPEPDADLALGQVVPIRSGAET